MQYELLQIRGLMKLCILGQPVWLGRLSNTHSLLCHAEQVALRRAVRIKAEASSSMQLLRSMLPSTVIQKLKAGQTYIAQHHEQVRF